MLPLCDLFWEYICLQTVRIPNTRNKRNIRKTFGYKLVPFPKLCLEIDVNYLMDFRKKQGEAFRSSLMFQELEIIIKASTFMFFFAVFLVLICIFQRIQPIVFALAKERKFSFSSLNDFVLLECLTHFLFSALLPSSKRTHRQQPYIQMRMNNIFISPLEAPDNALIEAEKPLLIPFFHGW